jgi:hypothetical protein
MRWPRCWPCRGAGDRLGRALLLVSWLGERVVGDLRRDLFAHVVRLGPAWFEIKRSATS